MSYADPLDPRARAARRKHYENNKDQYKRRNQETRIKAAGIIREAKDKPCMDCGIRYPSYVMDLDHRDPEEKLGNVNQMASRGLRRLKEEIEKCDVVCANCHRKRTWGSGAGNTDESPKLVTAEFDS